MSIVPVETHSPFHSQNALFVHSVEKGCDSQFRLQNNMETNLADMAPPLISVFRPFNFFLSWNDVACDSCTCIRKSCASKNETKLVQGARDLSNTFDLLLLHVTAFLSYCIVNIHDYKMSRDYTFSHILSYITLFQLNYWFSSLYYIYLYLKRTWQTHSL